MLKSGMLPSVTTHELPLPVTSLDLCAAALRLSGLLGCVSATGFLQFWTVIITAAAIV